MFLLHYKELFSLNQGVTVFSRVWMWRGVLKEEKKKKEYVKWKEGKKRQEILILKNLKNFFPNAKLADAETII